MGNASSSQSPYNYQNQQTQLQRSNTNRFRAIRDEFHTLEQVQDALRREGLESSNLIVAVDFTKSNEWTGKHSFAGRSLHSLGPSPNPYEEAMMAIGKTLAKFDDDNLIPAYGFGDASCQDSNVFSFNPGDAPCQGLESVVWRYRQLAPLVRLAGPTSFAPAIRHACKLVNDSGGKFHILLLIADGQVTRSSDLPSHQYSPQESATIAALVAASQLPLAVVMVGVGDGPWDMMKHFDDALPERTFDNFQFVNFSEIMGSCGADSSKREAQFALRALMEIPQQYRIIQRLGLLGRRVQLQPTPAALPPPAPPPAAMQQQQHMPFTPQPQQQFALQQSMSASAGPYSPQQQQQQQLACNGYPSITAASMPGWGIGQFEGAAGGSGLQQQHPSAAAPGQSFNPFSSNSSGSGGGTADVADPLSNSMFVCPITQDIMREPVIAADGYTYEKSAIQEWLAQRERSPMTNEPLRHRELLPNHMLRSAILEAREAATAARR